MFDKDLAYFSVNEEFHHIRELIIYSFSKITLCNYGGDTSKKDAKMEVRGAF